MVLRPSILFDPGGLRILRVFGNLLRVGGPFDKVPPQFLDEKRMNWVHQSLAVETDYTVHKNILEVTNIDWLDNQPWMNTLGFQPPLKQWVLI